MKRIIFCSVFLCTLIACSQQPVTEWVVSTADASWQVQPENSLDFIQSDSFDTKVDIFQPLQTIDGFGSCFNELGWTSLSELSDVDREAIMKELFEPGTGANFSICRMPVGANDFSRNWYSYDETAGDFELNNFSIANDKETLVPFIKNALKYRPDLKLWASPWSPPVWMKYNRHYACQNDLTPDRKGREGTNMFIQEDAYFQSYALYFAKFIEAYRNENIPIFMVMPQNEFNSCQVFPSCTWTASGLKKFVGEFLGPQMQKLGVELMFGTLERPNTLLVDTLLQDENCRKFLKGAGFQWAGKDAIGKIHADYPELKMYQTEQECGDGANDWNYCLHAWELLKHYLNNGANVYDYWNISLEKGGMSHWGWSQNSLITVDTQNKTYSFTYEYYLLKHASHYVLPGAVRLATSGSFSDLLAFKNLDESYVLIIHNDKETDFKPIIQVGQYQIAPLLKPDSFNTIVISK
jgi:glucosylceramidase